MHKLLQPGNIDSNEAGHPRHRISCCLPKHQAGNQAVKGALNVEFSGAEPI